MTSTDVAAVSNGHEPKERTERKTGLAYARQAELMHLSQVAADAFREAERLIDQLHRQAFEAHLGTDRESTEVDLDAAAEGIQSALVLTGMAEHYLRMLADSVTASKGDPWGVRGPAPF